MLLGFSSEPLVNFQELWRKSTLILLSFISTTIFSRTKPKTETTDSVLLARPLLHAFHVFHVVFTPFLRGAERHPHGEPCVEDLTAFAELVGARVWMEASQAPKPGLFFFFFKKNIPDTLLFRACVRKVKM